MPQQKSKYTYKHYSEIQGCIWSTSIYTEQCSSVP